MKIWSHKLWTFCSQDNGILKLYLFINYLLSIHYVLGAVLASRNSKERGQTWLLLHCNVYCPGQREL